ncbi:MAG: SIMPL domain-containing protein [Gloeobacterales cyanobacterium]
MQTYLSSRILKSATVLLFCSGLALASPAFAETPARTLTVTGRNEVSAPVSEAIVNLGVQVEGPTADKVQDELRNKVNRLLEVLKAASVKGLQTTNVQLYPRYRPVKDTQVIDGFTGQNNVSFRVPVAKSGEVLDAAVRAGANQVGGIQFDLSRSDAEKARSQALKGAVQDAQGQAQDVLEALGLKMKEIRTIQIQSDGVEPPRPFEALRSKAVDASPTPVVGGEAKVSASVTLEISY